jgi:diguanylate cyclase (GGDEF)-like protein
VSVSGTPVFDQSGRFTGYRGIGQDITTRKLAELALAESTARFKTLTDLSADWYWEQDENFRFTGQSWHNSTKAYAHGSFNKGLTRWEVPYVDMPDAVWDAHRAQLARHEVFRDFEVKRQESGGSISYYAISGSPRFDAQGHFIGYHGVGSDITLRRSAEEAAKRLAHYDTLTNLPNRALFLDRLAQELQRAQRSGSKVAVLLLDLDHFKEVNDTLGHDEGDRLLVQAGERVRGSVRQSDTVARLGGDEFVVILSDLGDRPAIENVAQNIITHLAEPFELETGSGHVSASVGIALFPDDAHGQEGLLKAVDQAMYAAKAAGRNRFSFFTPDLQEAAQNRMWLTNEMHLALDGGQFWVAFQPIVTLATGAVHKAEALIRWRHPERGLIGPGEFIPVAESCGLINPIGDWVFQQAARQAARCRTLYHPTFQISVNKSPVQFHNTRHVTLSWSLQLQNLGLDGDSIVAEITEGLLLDNSAAVATKLHDFREAGIQVALDDFGTGFSSLSYLQKHDIDYVKIDQAFVRNLQAGSKDYALCEAIVVMAHKLGIAVIAEGVETQAQCDLLVRAGCDYGQGYLFARPMPANEFEAFLTGRASP